MVKNVKKSPFWLWIRKKNQWREKKSQKTFIFKIKLCSFPFFFVYNITSYFMFLTFNEERKIKERRKKITSEIINFHFSRIFHPIPSYKNLIFFSATTEFSQLQPSPLLSLSFQQFIEGCQECLIACKKIVRDQKMTILFERKYIFIIKWMIFLM